MGKALANFVLVISVELVSLPVFGIFYNVHWTSQIWSLLLVLALLLLRRFLPMNCRMRWSLQSLHRVYNRLIYLESK